MLHKLFRPQPDITAYETAYILSHWTAGGVYAQSLWTGGLRFTEHDWQSLSPAMQRHFIDAEDEAEAA